MHINDTSIFQRNMNSLRQRYPDLAEKISQLPQTMDFLLWEYPDLGLSNVFSVTENKYFYGPNPMEDARDQIEALKIKNARIAVFLGFGLGYEVIHFVKNCVAKNKTASIIIIEKNLLLFKRAISVNDFSAFILDKKVHFIIGKESAELFLELKSCFDFSSGNMVFIKAIKTVYHASSLLWEKEYYMDALAKLKEVIIYCYAYLGNSPEDSLIGVRNMLSNINEIIDNMGVNRLYGKFEGKPAVVVSSGPSLNKNKHLLKGLENKALIIAADSALKILMEMGVKPHFVTMLERDYEMSKLLENFPEDDVKDSYFAACPVIDKHCYEVYPGPRMIVYRNFDHFRWLGLDRGILDIKQSAGNMSFKIAQALGCNPIILIGQDLSYGKDGHTHAKGMVFGDDRQEEKQYKSLEIPANDGGTVVTHEIWYQFLKSYEIDIESYSGVCINSTEGGALIRGTRIMPFAEAIAQHIKEEIYPLQIIRRQYDKFLKEKAASNDEKNSVTHLIETTILDMQHVSDICDQGLELLNEYGDRFKNLINNYLTADKAEREALQEIRSRIFDLKEKSKERKETFQLFFMHIAQSFYIKFEIDMIEAYEKNEEEEIVLFYIAYCHERWFRNIGELAKICLDLLKETQKDLK